MKSLTMILSVIITGLVGFALMSQSANASAPADLAVGMALQKYGVSGTVPLDYGARVGVVPKVTSNGIRIPIARSPYNGNHLSPGGGLPTTNALDFGIGTATYNNIFGGTFYARSFNNLIWCGNSVGVPDREFQMDVSVLQSTGSRQTISWQGRDYTGRWTGFWHFEGQGVNDVSSFFEGNSVRVPALNPYRTFVLFVFVEDPPEYFGAINTTKRLVGDNTVRPASSGAPYNSQIQLINYKNEVFADSKIVSNANPFFQNGIWVNSGGINLAGETSDYRDRVIVPRGYRVDYVDAYKQGTAPARANFSCSQPNNTGECTAGGLGVQNNKTTTVDWYFSKIPPTLDLSCTSDAVNTPGKITITAKTNIPGDPIGATVNADYDKNPPTTPKTLVTGSDSFDIDKDYRDGSKHTYYASYQGLNKSVSFGPNEQCKINAWYYPWLQTKNGNVIANGEIRGQQSGDKRLGSRVSSQKEAEYLIIASFAGNTEKGSNFCSIYNYILTNPQATNSNCTNGLGYQLNNNNLGSGNDDNVTKGVEQAYAEFPAECKSDNINELGSINIDSAVCPKGKIYKINNVNLPTINVIKGRATILLQGDLNISNSINYGGGSFSLPQDLPNLAIVAKGNVKIFSNISNSNSLIYSTGVINTCEANSPNLCNKQLSINGSLIAKDGFKFNRVYYDKNTRGAAETIVLNPVSVLYPPPGISSEYFNGYNNGATIDSGEFQPRF